ncbi:ABC transporter ATP-binding protein [Rhodopseudomonas palustris]|uniref:ABC transporter ATP-binding protein n=1 Tax=Rhodopseudomonas palustris TaxID=1076 RepID=A0A418V0Y7_RHOPL|nr:ABC transporter ATP-binding protein [Rhodopseudomonas palustris]RJF69512.1 ABC transporter ATP-binding protein [Rhodopseudomonas palustris]
MSGSAPAHRPVLAVKGLTVPLPPGADRPFAVEDVSFEILPGEIVCVVGESGSGKSVSSFSIMGLLDPALRPSHGEIRFGDRDLLRLPDKELRALRGLAMSMIFQEPKTALSPTMTVGRQIEEPLRIHLRMTAAQRRARMRELLRLVNLPEPDKLARRYPHQLSGGQRQRVMIAMALALEPALLIADEPTTALDVTTQAQILAEIKQIQRRTNTAVLFVTHDFGVVADIADRVVVMQKGRIVEQGPVAAVLTAPTHDYTRSLMAAIPGVHNRTERAAPEQAPVILQLDGLSKTYPPSGFAFRQTAHRALDNVNLVVRRGETLAVVGESGSGKSTMARCVSGLIPATAGSIEIDGRPIDAIGAGERARLLQFVFQDPNRSLDPRWTVGKSLSEGLRNLGVPRKQALDRASELMAKVGLGAAAVDRYPHEFSGGQRQRLCIARAISMEPRLLIADEAVSALDVSVQAQILKLLATLQKELQLSMIFVTHDLRVAVQISDRIAVMHQGQVVEIGPALEIFRNPQHAYSRRLFEALPGRGLSA